MSELYYIVLIVIVTLVSGVWLNFSTTPPLKVTQEPVSIPVVLKAIGEHGSFNIMTSQEVEQAYAHGVQYTIPDFSSSEGPTASVNPKSSVGAALLHYHMKSFLMLSDLYVFDSAGNVSIDESTLKQRVSDFSASPLLAGYWAKDDDPAVCGGNVNNKPMTQAMERMYKLIRDTDHDLNHPIVMGFCDIMDLSRNYYPVKNVPLLDVLAFYPYPSHTGGLGAQEMPSLLKVVKDRTPTGVTIPKFIGIYQDFWSDNSKHIAPISQEKLISDVKTFLANGALSIVGFSFEATDVNHTAGNDSQMLQYVQDVTNLLKTSGKY